MCPLRILLIFLSATLAGFFVLRGLKAEPELVAHKDQEAAEENFSPLTKFRSAICGGFWTCVDMASGRYLWRNLVSSNSSKAQDKKEQ